MEENPAIQTIIDIFVGLVDQEEGLLMTNYSTLKSTGAPGFPPGLLFLGVITLYPLAFCSVMVILT